MGANEKHFKRFHHLLFSFVLSIFLLIISPNLIRILLGWDGLGISSYLLVIYYSRKKSYNAGILTLLTNRIGDSLLILALSFSIFLRRLNINNFFFEFKKDFFWVVIMIAIAAGSQALKGIWALLVHPAIAIMITTQKKSFLNSKKKLLIFKLLKKILKLNARINRESPIRFVSRVSIPALYDFFLE